MALRHARNGYRLTTIAYNLNLIQYIVTIMGPSPDGMLISFPLAADIPLYYRMHAYRHHMPTATQPSKAGR